MHTVHTAGELRRRIAAWRRAGERIGFVPTMGALHAGHLSLVERAGRIADRVVASIFVNPTQFGPGEDLDRYPRTPEQDARRLAQAGCHLLFAPDAETIYPPGFSTYVEPGGPAEGLEGAFRPGHFRGVATVVTILFNLVQPDVAVFGEKDAQQLAVIRKLVRDLALPVEIVAGETVREADGLALSSRNVFLELDERRAARVLSQALEAAREAIAGGERRAEEIRRVMREVLAAEPRAVVEYAEVVDGESFQPVDDIGGHVVLPLAVRIGRTRLIDNLQIPALSPLSQRGEEESRSSPSRKGREGSKEGSGNHL